MLELQEVTKVYSSHKLEVRAVEQVSLRVAAGEAVAIEGPSGCGKSTLLLIAGALLRPTTGSVLIDGESPYAMKPNQRSTFRARKVGFVFQQFHLLPYLNVLQNVLTANVPHPRSDPQQRANELIGHFGLEPRRHHLPSELSVGERQRVAMARALFNEPALVLADEPTGNLDPNNAVIVLDALRQYADQGKAVLMVTHDPSAASRAHRVLRMDQGRLPLRDDPTSLEISSADR